MRDWGPWDWIAWGTLGLSALGLAFSQVISGSDELKQLLPNIFKAGRWNYLPAALFCISASIFLIKEAVSPRVQTAAHAEVSGEHSGVVSEASLQLQFFGDERIPVQIASNNIVNWFAYYSPRIVMEAKGQDGKPLPGGVMSTPLCWVIFLNLDKPASYRQAVVSYVNQENAPITGVSFATNRSIVVTTGGAVPATVMDIHTLN